MFELQIFDRKGKKLNLGDFVKISDGKRFTFFCEVKYLDKEQVLTPFHTFGFHSVEKVKSIPKNATKSTEERYDIWYIDHDDAELDTSAESFKDYLMDWRACEHLLESRMFRIVPIKN